METRLLQAESNTGRKLNARSTEQRSLILRIIQRADRHLDADEIYRQARQKLPGISLSTVYRSLQLFRDLGLVEEHQLNGMRRCYESTSRSKHQHLVCWGCGRVLEFCCPSTESLKSRISKQEGFEVINAEVRLTGYCPECLERLSDKMTNAEQGGSERR